MKLSEIKTNYQSMNILQRGYSCRQINKACIIHVNSVLHSLNSGVVILYAQTYDYIYSYVIHIMILLRRLDYDFVAIDGDFHIINSR